MQLYIEDGKFVVKPTVWPAEEEKLRKLAEGRGYVDVVKAKFETVEETVRRLRLAKSESKYSPPDSHIHRKVPS